MILWGLSMFARSTLPDSEVTHGDICVTNEDVTDKFRIFFSQLKNKKFEPIG